jgi:hypothetical protein
MVMSEISVGDVKDGARRCEGEEHKWDACASGCYNIFFWQRYVSR